RLPRGVGRTWRHGVPRAHFLADVAAIHMRADAGAAPGGDGSPQLDREIRNTARRIEDAWRDERVSGTRLETQRACPALIQRRRIDLEWQTADDFREEDPRSEPRVDDARVLANPADAGILRVDPFLDRTSVNVGARVERLRRRGPHPAQQLVEPPANHVVIVIA